MTLFRQNIITVFLLFILLGLLYSVVSHSLQIKEFNWSVEQDAAAVGGTIHEFISTDFETYFSKSPDGNLGVTNQLERVLERMAVQNSIRELAVWDSSLNLIYLDSRQDGELTGTTDASEYRERSLNENLSHLYKLDLDAENPVLDIYTYLDGTGETEFGPLILVRKDAASYAAIYSQLIRWTVIEFVITLIAGLLVSLILTSILKRSIRDLFQKSSLYVSGEKEIPLNDNPVSEFNELGDTLHILVDVLDNHRVSSRKKMVEREQARSPLELASAFKNTSNPGYSGTIANRQIRYGTIHPHATRYFTEHLIDNGRMVIVSGSVRGDHAAGSALQSDAMARLIIRFIKGESISAAVKRAESEFHSVLEKLTVIDIQKNGKLVRHYYDEERIQSGHLQSNPNGIVTICDCNEKLDRRIRHYTDMAEHDNIEQLFDEISILIGNQTTGPLIVIGPYAE